MSETKKENWEARCVVERKPGSEKPYINRMILSFDHQPDSAEIAAEFTNNPDFIFKSVERIWGTSERDKELCDYYASKTYTGD